MCSKVGDFTVHALTNKVLPEHFDDWTLKSQRHLSTLNPLQVNDTEFKSHTSSGKILVIQSPVIDNIISVL